MSSNASIKLLIAEDEKNLGLVLQKELSRLGHEVTLVHDGEAALQAARDADFDVALLDIMMPVMGGIEALRELRQQEQPPEVLMMTGHATVETALQAMKLGAYDYLTKPCHIRELEAILNKAYEKRQLRRENLILQSRLTYKEKSPDIIVHSKKMTDVMSLVRKVATTNAIVLVTGESGTGKELVANTIHRFSLATADPSSTLAAPRFRKLCSNPNCSDTNRAPLPERASESSGCWSWLTAELSSSTRSAK